MMYEPYLKQVILDTLENKVSSIATCITVLVNEGYLPNKNKSNVFNACLLLIDCYESVDVLTKEQQDMLDVICNKILKM